MYIKFSVCSLFGFGDFPSSVVFLAYTHLIVK